MPAYCSDTTPPPSEKRPERDLSDQILKLAKAPPAAVFDSPEGLMHWLENQPPETPRDISTGFPAVSNDGGFV